MRLVSVQLPGLLVYFTLCTLLNQRPDNATRILTQEAFFANVDKKNASHRFSHEQLQSIAMDLLGWRDTDDMDMDTDTVSISPKLSTYRYRRRW